MLFADTVNIDWFDNGVAAAVLLFVGGMLMWIAKRMFGKDGPVDKVVATHIRYVDSSDEMQRELKDRLHGHMETEERHIERVRRIGMHACDAMDEVAEKLSLSETSRQSLHAIRAELQSQSEG